MRRRLFPDADLREVYTANTGHADADFGIERVRAGALHLPAPRDDRREHLWIEQAAPDFGGCSRKDRRAFALQRSAQLDAATFLLRAAVRAARGNRLRVGQLPEPIERQRQLDVLAAERIGGRVGERGGSEHGASVAHALGTRGIHGRGGGHVADVYMGHLRSGRAQVFRECAGHEISRPVVHQFFVQRRAQAMREAAVDLALDDHRIEHRADVVHRNVFDDLDLSRGLVDLDCRKIGDEAVGHRGRDAIGGVRAGERRRIEHESLGHSRADAGGHACRIPVRPRGKPADAYRALRVGSQTGGAVDKLHRIETDLEVLGGHLAQLDADLARTAQHRAGHRGSEAVRVIAGRDTPRDGARIRLSQDVHVVRIDAKFLCHDLGGYGRVALAVGRAVELDRDPAARVDRDRDRRIRARLRLGLVSLLGRLRKAHVGHVRAGGFHAKRKADAEEFAGLPRGFAPRKQRRVVGKAQHFVEALLIVAGVQLRAGRGIVGELVFLHQIPAAQLGRVDAKPACRDLHDPLEREVKLRPAIATVEAGGHAVRNDERVVDREVLDPVCAARSRVHAIDRRRLGRADVGAKIHHVAVPQAKQFAVFRECRFDLSRAIGGARGRHQVLEAVLGPLYRYTHQARHRCDQHHVGIHRLLDAEAAARIRRRHDAQPVARHIQRTRHQGLQHERALEIRPDRIAIGMRLELRDHPVSLHRRGNRARKTVGVFESAFGAREGIVGVAVFEFALLRYVRARFLEEQRRIRLERVVEVRHARQRFVVDFDQFKGILGYIAVHGHHDRDGLAAIARLGRRAHLETHLRAHHARDDAGDRRDLRARDDADNARQLFGRAHIYRADTRMRMRRTQDRRVAQTRHRLQIVDKAPAAGEERRVLLAGDGPADPACCRTARCHCASAEAPFSARRKRDLSKAPSRGGRTRGIFSATTFTWAKFGPASS